MLAAIHGPRLERVLEEIVDTPVRGFVYEPAGTVEPRLLARGGAIVAAAGERWRIPVELVDFRPGRARRLARRHAGGDRGPDRQVSGRRYCGRGPGLP